MAHRSGGRRALAKGCAATAAALLLVAVRAPGVGAEETASSRGAALKGCQESFAPIPASAAEVRPYVPAIDDSRYRIFGEDLGVATLVVRIFACDSLKVPGSRRRPTLGAQFGVTLESPDGTGRFLGSDACCNWYTFFWVTDNWRFGRWLKGTNGIGGVVRYVKSLVYRYRANPDTGTAAISFTADEPTPSPFEFSATVATPTDSGPAAELSANWWAETPEGTIKVANHTPAFQTYQANGEVRTRPGTQMAALFHEETKPFGSPFSYGRWDRSFMSKSAVRPSPPSPGINPPVPETAPATRSTDPGTS